MDLELAIKNIRKLDLSSDAKFEMVMNVLNTESGRISQRRYRIARSVFESNNSSDQDIFTLLFRHELSNAIAVACSIKDFEMKSYSVASIALSSFDAYNRRIPNIIEIIKDVIAEKLGGDAKKIERLVISHYESLIKEYSKSDANEKTEFDFYKWLVSYQNQGALERKNDSFFCYFFSTFIEKMHAKMKTVNGENDD